VSTAVPLLERIAARIEEHESEQPSPLARSKNPIDALWRPIGREALTVPPPARAWLLRHPTKNWEACDPAFGDGMLPLGKAGVLASEGGAGKTQALVQLGISIITGRSWLDHFSIGAEAIGRHVLLALAEEDREESDRRSFEVARAMRLSDSEIDLVAERLIVLPLAGFPVALLRRSALGGDPTETDELASLRRQLTDSGAAWGLVALDPRSRWCGPDTESDNAAATRTVQALESLVRVPGNPTVLVAAHSSKLSRREGGVDTRGVTGITDGLRWEGQLRVQDADAPPRQAKSNDSRPMPKSQEVQLVRAEDGVLRVATDTDRAEQVEAEGARTDAVLERNVERVVGAVASRSPVGAVNRDQIVSWAKLGTAPGRRAVAEAITRGLIANAGSERNQSWSVSSTPPRRLPRPAGVDRGRAYGRVFWGGGRRRLTRGGQLRGITAVSGGS